MNILITGASGFIGRALSKKLAEGRDKIFLVSRNKNFKMKGAKIYSGDLSNENFCKKIVKNIDTSYYLAAKRKNIYFHTKQTSEYVQGNLQPLLTFLEAVQKSKVKKIVYLSSTLVEYIHFDTPEYPSDGYVLGKYIGELVVKAFAQQNPKINVIIVRSAAVYGPGDNFNPTTAPFIPAIIGRVHKSKDEFVVWGKGKRKLQYIYIDDLVKNLIDSSKRKKGAMPVIGNPETVSVDKIVKKIIQHSDKKLKIAYDATKPDKQTKLVKFNNLVKPKVNLDHGLKMTIEYYRKQ